MSTGWVVSPTGAQSARISLGVHQIAPGGSVSALYDELVFHEPPIFADGFESGNLCEWSGECTDAEAAFPLITHLEDVTGNYGDVILLGSPDPPAPPSTNSPLCLIGPHNLPGGGQEIATPNISGLNTDDFQIDVEFRLSGLPPFWEPIIVGGYLYRWIALFVDANGTVGAKYNNSIWTWSSTTVTAERWYAAQLKFEAGRLQIFLDGLLIHDVDTGVSLNTGGYLDLRTTDHSGAGALYGCIRNLYIYNDTTLGAKKLMKGATR
jgi:hypothetical protein